MRSTTIWASYSSIRTTSPGCTAAKPRGCLRRLRRDPLLRRHEIVADEPLTPALSPRAGRGRDPRQREGEGHSRREEGRLLANLMHFARTLRAAGLPVGPGKVIDAVVAVR